MYPFERLLVWQRAHDVALEVYAASASWRDWDLRSQLRRCSSSVAANIAEGAGCDSPAQFARYLSFALASSAELRYHLLYARDVGLLPATDHAGLDSATQEVRRMLVGLRRRIVTQRDAPRGV
jgi:four helix bundle protein